jgi:hypothetical protein
MNPLSQESTSTTRGTTDATQIGYLQLRTAIILLLIASGTILITANAVNTSLTGVGLVLVSGVIATMGLRLTTNYNTYLTVTSTLSLWVSGFVFIGGIGLITPTTQSVHELLIIPIGALLTTFGILGNTIEQFGEGVSKQAMKEYFFGVIVLSFLLIIAAGGKILSPTILSSGGEVLAGISGQNTENVFGQGVIAIFVYGLVLWVVKHTVKTAPLELLFTGNNYEKITRINSLEHKLYEAGLFVIGVYLLTVVGGYIAYSQTNHVAGELLRGVVSVTASVEMLLFFVTIMTVLIAGWVGSAVIGRVVDINTERMIGVMLPPVIVTITAVVIGDGFGGMIRTQLKGTGVSDAIASNDVISALYTDELSLLLLGVVGCVLLVNAVVFSLPSLISGLGAVKSPISGVITACIGITLVVVGGVIGGSGGSVVLGGVLTTMFVWSVGEHSVVATGELKPVGVSVTEFNPEGLTRITTLHGMIVLAVGCVGFVFASGVIAIAKRVELTETAAVVAIVLAGVGVLVVGERVTAKNTE